MSAVTIYTSKDYAWSNAAGDTVPVKFIPKSDLVKERHAGKIYKSALALEASIKAFYGLMTDAFDEIKKAVNEDYIIKKSKEKKLGKGSFTWYNFDKSLKIEADVQDIVKWDGPLMTEALGQLNAYISGSIGDSNELIKQLVNDAFAGSKGQIDSRKVFQLLKYESKIKDKRFLKACEMIKQAQSLDKSKLYMRVWEKADNGEYRNINLSFSSI
jgi:hypothetical protein